MKAIIQEGLQQEIVVGKYTKYSILTSEKGYCFYDKTKSVLDETGTPIPEEEIKEEQRQYFVYCSTPDISKEMLNNKFVSVLIKEGFKIA